MKRCSGCGLEKERTEFHVNRSRHDGLQHRCKACGRSYGRTRVEGRNPVATRLRPKELTPRQAVAWYIASGTIECDVQRPFDECWEWMGYRSATGYGQLFWKGFQPLAHRFVFEAMTREDAGEHLHHECRVRECVNPNHLTPVTAEEHAQLHAA